MSITTMAGLPFQVILPILSAVVYVAGALLLKRAADLGVEAWRMLWVCNLAAAAAFAPLVLLGGTMPPLVEVWKPAVVALLFALGQALALGSLRIGDVSVATPVLGLKILLVALFTTLVVGDPLTARLWGAALLSSVAIALLQTRHRGSHHDVGATIIMAGLAAAGFALFDVLVQKWSPTWGLGRFLPAMMGFVALYSLGLPWLFGRSGASFPRQPGSGLWLAGGAACLAVQSVMFVLTIAMFGQATTANVLYSSRGLWSVIAVWLVGHWFGSREQSLGKSILAWRLAGAALLLIAVALVLV